MTRIKIRTTPRYTPLAKVDDARIRHVGVTRFADDPADVAWLDPEHDSSAKQLANEAS